MLCFSTTFLLATTCLLVNAGFPLETTTTCDGDFVHRLSCTDDGVISVQTALYGREDSKTCIEGRPSHQFSSTACSLQGAVDVLKSRCDGKKVCELSVNVFGSSDPCFGTYKYLQTKYHCLPAIHLITCEHSVAHLHCDEGQVISVYHANYGRTDQTTCSYKRSASQTGNIDCINPTSKVAESCDGENSCTIVASNSVFGDPCAGIYKYLEVAYVCQFCPHHQRQRSRPIESCKTMLCFSTTFLLATTCLLVNAGFPLETTTTCDGDFVHRLSCNIGVISVQTALYGREDSKTCIEGKTLQEISNTECSLQGAVDVLKSRCDGKKVCELSVNVFGSSDTCSDTYKYLQTKYDCLPAIHLITCEHSVAHLHCDEGQIISVYNADYGRTDQTTCSYKRSASQTGNIDCINPTSKVAESCGGKNNCTIEASNSVFGDPCVSTYKYLEVAYVCQFSRQTEHVIVK
ncbi:rhamnose-binding lectin-like [Thunnus maccoyii]|uniref:rhamnose-binding lectin-like n=1 Tax=Thunnus maccoyii TaxID=8240 RepID=UPI001C4CBB7D|nr:rhamnose-binding lectin-like [Thunnus maccoyii]